MIYTSKKIEPVKQQVCLVLIEEQNMKDNRKLIAGSIAIALLLVMGIVSCVAISGTSQDQLQQADIEDFIYCTFLGGANLDHVRDVTTDSQDNFIVAGYTMSADFPVKNPYQSSHAGGGQDVHQVSGDAFVAKFDKEGQLLWSTYLGGSSNDGGKFANVLTDDSIVVVGMTKSSDFPTTTDAYQRDYSAGYDMFITKFAANGSVIYSSYLGATGDDAITDFELDSSGNLVIAGSTTSEDFPVTANAYQPVTGGGLDVFLMRLSADCSTILYSTFLGGSGHEGIVHVDFAQGIGMVDLDAQGNIIVSGATASSDFPVTEDAYQDSIRGGRDIYIAKYNPSGQLTYATYFGGSHSDDCYGVGVDSIGNVIITGKTLSADFPTAHAWQNAWQANYINNERMPDGYVTKFNADGQELNFSSYFGGSGWDTVHHVNVDSNDNIIVSGIADIYSTGFPILDAFQEEIRGHCDIVIMMISPDGQPVFGTYLGGGQTDHPFNQYLTDDYLHIAGFTVSTDFPVTSTAYQRTYNGNEDGYIVRFDIDGYLTSGSRTSEATTDSSSSTAVPGFDLFPALVGMATFLVIRWKKE
ncbi:MAG: SBBP repeat-containing protein [Candidatus Odinarchaeota archaeon]